MAFHKWIGAIIVLLATNSNAQEDISITKLVIDQVLQSDMLGAANFDTVFVSMQDKDLVQYTYYWTNEELIRSVLGNRCANVNSMSNGCLKIFTGPYVDSDKAEFRFINSSSFFGYIKIQRTDSTILCTEMELQGWASPSLKNIKTEDK